MVCIPGEARELDGSNVQCETLQVRRCLTVAGVDVAPVGVLTPGSIPFANAAGALTQDNTRLFWHQVGRRVGIGTNAPDAAYVAHLVNVNGGIAGVLAVQNSNPTGFGAVNVLTEAGVFAFGIGRENSTGINYLDLGGSAFEIGSGVNNLMHFIPEGAFQFSLSVAPANAAATQARLALGANKLRLSQGSSGAGAGYFDIATYAAALSTGLLPFANAFNQLAQDALLGWESAGKTLFVNDAFAASGAALVVKTHAGNIGIQIKGADSGSYASTIIYDQLGVQQGGWGYGGTTAAAPFAGNNFIYSRASVPVVIIDGASVLHSWSTSGTLSYSIGGNKVIGPRGAAVADAAGGAVIDAEARTALNALLARLRIATGHGLIA